MIANTDILLFELEHALCAVFELSEQYKLFNQGMSWQLSKSTMEAWQKAIYLANDIASLMVDEDIDFTFDDICRIYSLLSTLRELRNELPIIFTHHKDVPSSKAVLAV